jgi:protocatechuate 3,4-dioxygenase, beta subunit
VFAYRRPRPGTQPEHRHPPYVSSLKRAPSQPLVPLPQTGSELSGPGFAGTAADRQAIDLTRGRAGAALGERIVVSGRVRDEDGRALAGALVELWQANAAGR